MLSGELSSGTFIVSLFSSPEDLGPDESELQLERLVIFLSLEMLS